MTAVSIIVPLHNSKKYLRECIDSILVQTLPNIEIVCVDSSTDGTTDILYAYQKKDERICVIEDSNASYGHKLNVGIQSAAGEYIAIVESDDYIAEDMMKKMYEVAHAYHLDFIHSNYEGFIDTKNGRKTYCFDRRNDDIYDRVISLKQEVNIMPLVGHSIWTGLYRTQFLRNKGICLHESEGASYQDTGFYVLTALLADHVYFLKDAFYKYRMDNEGSSVKSDKKYRYVSEEYAWIERKMKELGCHSELDIAFFKLKKLYSYHWNYLRLSDEYREKLIDYTAQEKLGDFDEELFNYRIYNKEHMVKLCRGDVAARNAEDQIEKKKSYIYKKLIHIFKNYKSIVIVSAGLYGKAVYQMLQLSGYETDVSVCDNYIQGNTDSFDSIKVLNIQETVLRNQDAYYIIANKHHGMELMNQLEALGVSSDNIYICDMISYTEEELFRDFVKYVTGDE